MGDDATLSRGETLMRKASPGAFWPFAARVRRIATSVSVGLAALLLAGGAVAGTVCVSPTGSDETGDGSPASPYGTIDHAYARAADGDVIELATGTYTLQTPAEYLLIDRPVTIRGIGETAADVVVRPAASDVVMRFFSLSNDLARIERLTLTGALNEETDSASQPAHTRDGAFLLYAGTLADCAIADNRQRDVGAVRQFGGLITGCRFEGNTAQSHWNHSLGLGAALFQQGGVTSNCLFRSNYTRCRAGAVCLRGGLLTHSTFTDNWIERLCGTAVMLGGGTLANCRVTENRLSGWDNGFGDRNGGTIALYRGEVVDCVVCSNAVRCSGGGILVAPDLAESLACDGTKIVDPAVSARRIAGCEIFDNEALYLGGGILMGAPAVVDRCTVVGNRAAGGGYGIGLSAGVVRNTIAYGNGPGGQADPVDILCTGEGSVSNSCSRPLVAGGGNWADDPLLADLAARDFTLLPGSRAIGGGAAEDGTACDCGARAYAEPDEPRCAFTVSPSVLDSPGPVVLQAYADGAGREGLTFSWDLDGDGVYGDATGETVEWQVPGYASYGVSLALVNANGLPIVTWTRPAAVTVRSSRAYVNANGTAVYPYVTPETGARTLEDALLAVHATEEQPAEIVFCDGTYEVKDKFVSLLTPVRITSEHGPAATFLQANAALAKKDNARVLVVDHPQALVSGLTIEKGKWSSYAFGDEGCGGLRLVSGVVSNCVIRDCLGCDFGGGVNVRGGLLTHCEIYGNRAYRGNNENAAAGGGIAMTGGEMTDCVVSNNLACNPDGGCGVKIAGAATVRRCLIADNRGQQAKTGGIGLWMNSGLVERCRIVGNGVHSSHMAQKGAGVVLGGGRLVNCLVAGNRSGTQSAGVHQTGGELVNCTIVGNVSESQGGSGLFLDGSAAVARNNVIYGNGAGVAVEPLSNLDYRKARSFDHNVVLPAPDGTDNIADDPRFRDAANGDYLPDAGSPCIDAALEIGLTEDLVGTPRPKDGTGAGTPLPDIGCLEAPGRNEGPLICTASTSEKTGVDAVTATLTASVGGAGSDGTLVYAWNVGAGEIQGAADGPVVTAVFPVGKHDVTLTVRTADGTRTATKTLPGLVAVGVAKAHVNGFGTGAWPYATPETATNDVCAVLASAILEEGRPFEIEVDDGTYPILDKWLLLTMPAHVHSKNGPGRTTLLAANPKAADARKLVHLNNPQARVEGLTLAGGWWDQYRYADPGGVVRVTAGTLRNCVIRDSLGADNAGGADIWGGTVADCRFVDCESFRFSNAAGQGRGAGFHVYGPARVTGCVVSNCFAGVLAGAAWIDHAQAVVSNCVFTQCQSGISKRYQKTFDNNCNNEKLCGGVLVTAGTLVNSVVDGCYAYNKGCGGLRLEGKDARAVNVLVAGNAAAFNAQGAQVVSGAFVNGTVAGNGTNAVPSAAALKLEGGTFENGIVWANGACAAQVARTGGTIARSCFPEATGTDGNLSADPRFRNPVRGDWRLKGSSPCIDAGDWRALGAERGAVCAAEDLLGAPRLRGRDVDLGACECHAGGLMLFVR